MNLLEKFEKLNNRLTVLLEENKELKQQYKFLQGENEELREKLDKRDYKNLQEENKELKIRLEERNKQYQEHILNLEKQKNEQLELNWKYKNLQEENKKLKENFNEIEKQFQQHILNLEKQKNEQLEIFSQNLEKALGKLELNDNENEIDIRYLKEKNKSTTFPLIDDDIKDKEFIQPIEDSSGSVPSPSKDKSNQTHRSGYLHPENEYSENKNDIRVVVGLDFGTTYSGFSYCHVNCEDSITTNDMWHGESCSLKTNTVLQYDSNFENVEKWGYPALSKRPRRNQKKKNESETRPVELFKLHLTCNLDNKPYLPKEFDYQKAIIDYLREIGKVIKETIDRHWERVNFFQHVLLVFTVPAEYSNKEIGIMRKCVFNAGLIKEKDSKNLQFTTEPEAVAIYCLNVMGEELKNTIGSNFMVVDCGGGTVDLTTRKLLENKKLSEITERTGDYCGSTFIDKEFINFLGKKLGHNAIDLFRENYYGQLQYMVQDFCRRIKFVFAGDERYCESYELDFESTAPALLQYVKGEAKEIMEENDWIIDIKFEDIKAMFDPVVNKIINLIRLQLSNTREKCSAIFLAGGFSESEYLRKRIIKEFQQAVYVPKNPIASISLGAVMYGLSLRNDSVISNRILKYTYGIEVVNYWMEGDPISKRLHNGRIVRFHCLAKRGTQVETNQKVTTFFTPLSPLQTRVSFKIIYTKEYDAKYCDEPDMRLLGKLVVHLPGSGLLDRLLFEFTFGQMEITVNVKNETNGQNYSTKFNYYYDD